MVVTLKDNKSFKYFKGDKVVAKSTTRHAYGRLEFAPIVSINMNSRVSYTWSNGWCPIVKVVKRKDDYFALIDNMLIPQGIYDNCKVELNDRYISK